MNVLYKFILISIIGTGGKTWGWRLGPIRTSPLRRAYPIGIDRAGAIVNENGFIIAGALRPDLMRFRL